MPSGYPTGRFPGASGQQSPSGKTFNISFQAIERAAGTALTAIIINSQTAPQSVDRNRIASVIKGIVNDELADLMKNVLVPIYKSYAPYKGGWPDHLRSSIQSVPNRDGMSAALRMAWYGDLTIEGHSGPRPGTRIRMELPGGGERWFTVGEDEGSTGEATTRAEGGDADNPPPLDAGRARFRMEWFKRASEQIDRNHWYEQYAVNITRRLLTEFFGDVLGRRNISYPHATNETTSTYQPLIAHPQRLHLLRQHKSLEAKIAREDARIERAYQKNANTLHHYHRNSAAAVRSHARAEVRRRHYETRAHAIGATLNLSGTAHHGRRR